MILIGVGSLGRRWIALLGGCLCGVGLVGAGERAAPTPAAGAGLVEVRKIWDAGQHNAFTDLIQWRGRWWCTFREAEAHVGGDGAIRVLESADGAAWNSAALVVEKDIDLRDPKFSVTPDDRLMIVCGGSVYLGTKQLKGRQSRVLFSADGRTWTPPARVLQSGEWLWRVTWHDGVAYGAAYDSGPRNAEGGPAEDWRLTLYASRDALRWEKITDLAVSGRPNETTLRFLPNGDLLAMVRREGGDRRGVWGRAAAPYRQWAWTESTHQFGGPNFTREADGGWIVCTRDYTTPPPGAAKGVTTMVGRLGDQGKLLPLAWLPSGGDCSYAGLAWQDGLLWVSYYSSHEGKTAIYLAKIDVGPGARRAP